MVCTVASQQDGHWFDCGPGHGLAGQSSNNAACGASSISTLLSVQCPSTTLACMSNIREATELLFKLSEGDTLSQKIMLDTPVE